MDQTLIILRLLLAALLYGFLALLLYVMWQGLQTRSRDHELPYEPADLIVKPLIDNHHRDAAKTEKAQQQLTLKPVTAIGRAQDNHVILDDPFASANHAIVVWRDGRWWVEDLDSHNGTLLNGEAVAKPQPLASGDYITIGETSLLFEQTRPQGTAPEDKRRPSR
jgi:hypothetical protein